MATLGLGGCSFSDYRYDLKPYGAQVAAHYGQVYLHEAACAGSNYRIWRTLTRHIINKTIQSGDAILIQYTLLNRSEAWTPYQHYIYEKEKIFEQFDGGTLLRLTPHFDQFAKTKAEKQLSHCVNYFYNYKLALEQFWTQHFCFAEMCAAKGIQLIYINSQYDADHRIPEIDLSHILKEERYCLDSGHMNQLGHDTAAQCIIDFLNQANMPNFRV
jgi:hypothetical protein